MPFGFRMGFPREKHKEKPATMTEKSSGNPFLNVKAFSKVFNDNSVEEVEDFRFNFSEMVQNHGNEEKEAKEVVDNIEELEEKGIDETGKKNVSKVEKEVKKEIQLSQRYNKHKVIIISKGKQRKLRKGKLNEEIEKTTGTKLDIPIINIRNNRMWKRGEMNEVDKKTVRVYGNSDDDINHAIRELQSRLHLPKCLAQKDGGKKGKRERRKEMKKRKKALKSRRKKDEEIRKNNQLLREVSEMEKKKYDILPKKALIRSAGEHKGMKTSTTRSKKKKCTAPTHFFSLNLTGKGNSKGKFVKEVEDLQRAILKDFPKELNSFCRMPSFKLHFTFSVFSLRSKEQKENMIEIAQKVVFPKLKEFLGDCKELVFDGVGVFDKDHIKKTRVLFLMLKESDAKHNLEAFGNFVSRTLLKEKIIQKKENFVLHATLFNVKYSRKSKDKTLKIHSFNAEGILKKYGKLENEIRIPISTFEISNMNKDKKGAYYTSRVKFNVDQ